MRGVLRCVPQYVSSGPGRNTEGTIRYREVPHAPQCSSTAALQLNCILRRDKHIIRSGCKHRPISIDEYKDLGHMSTGMHTVAQAQLHRHLDMHIPSMLALHPARCNPSPLFPPSRAVTRYVQSGPIQSFPQCTGWISVYKNWVRCKHCVMLLFAQGYMCAN